MSEPAKKVLLTGATGFLGRSLLRQLAASGWQVRATTRNSPPVDPPGTEKISWHRVCLLSGAGLSEALEGVDAVIHAAGGGYITRSRDLWQNNLQTTQTLVDAALRQNRPIPHWLLVSSLAARGPAHGNGHAVSDYGRAKQASEACALTLAEHGQVTIVRPPSLFGTGDERLAPLQAAIRRGRVFLPREAGRVSWLHVEDCAKAIALSLARTPGPPVTYELCDGAPLNPTELTELWASSLGIPAPSIAYLPRWILFGAGYASATWAAWTGNPTVFSADKVRDMVAGDWIGDPTRIQTDLGWSPDCTFSEWLRLQHTPPGS